MEGQPVLRLFSCRPRRAAFDRILRDVLIPDLRALGDVTDVFAGRQGPDDLGERLVASVWSSTPEMTAALLVERLTRSRLIPAPPEAVTLNSFTSAFR